MEELIKNEKYNLKENEIYNDLEEIDAIDKDIDIVSINYREKFKIALGYFRCIIKKEELSERGMNIIDIILYYDPSNYFAWTYRRKIIKYLNLSLYKELNFISKSIIDNPKVYQSWNHRKWVVEKLSDYSNENEFLEIIFNDDSKNYHAWQYKLWLVDMNKMWKNELKFIEIMINIDPFNNSFWNFRYQIINNTIGFYLPIIMLEIEFTFSQLKQNCNNQSAWKYLFGIIPINHYCKFINIVLHKVKLLKFDSSSQKPCRYAHEFIALFLFNLLLQYKDYFNLFQHELLITLNLLADKLDTIRSNYWNSLKNMLFH